MQEVIWIKRLDFSNESSLVLHTYGSFVQQSRDAEDVAVTDVRYGAFDDALAAFQTPVALEGIPGSLPLNPVEHFHLSEPGYQHQLQKGTGAVIKDEPGLHGERSKPQTGRTESTSVYGFWMDVTDE